MNMELQMNANVAGVGREGESEGWRRLSWSRMPLLRSGLVALPRRSGGVSPPAPREAHPPPVDTRPSQTDLIRLNLM